MMMMMMMKEFDKLGVYICFCLKLTIICTVCKKKLII